MKRNRPGYPLPVGELGDAEIVCQLVYLPDEPEYWQAFYSTLHYLTTWLAWAPDDAHRAQDAAANWRKAFELTSECWRMTCLEEITERMDLIIDLLANQPDCCDGPTIGPIITVITNITPGEGDDPTHWGETEVADWDEWLEYICYHAHVYVDTLVESAKALDFVAEVGGYTLSFLAALIRSLQFLTLGHPVSLTDAQDMYRKFRDAVDLIDAFVGVGDKFEAARDEIVCAIMLGNSLKDAIEDALDDNVLWLLFYNFTDYSAVQALIYEGTADNVGFLPANRRDDCECEGPASSHKFTYTFNSETTIGFWDALAGNQAFDLDLLHLAHDDHPQVVETGKSGLDISDDFLDGEAHDFRLRRIRFDWRLRSDHPTKPWLDTDYLELEIRAGGVDRQPVRHYAVDLTNNVWEEIDLDEDALGDSAVGQLSNTQSFVTFLCLRQDGHGAQVSIEVDNVELWIDEVPS